MPLWKKLYRTVNLAFLCCAVVPVWLGYSIGLPIHTVLGLTLMAFATLNWRQIETIPVPPRLRRVAKALVVMCAVAVVTGLGLAAISHIPDAPTWARPTLLVPHVIAAFAGFAKTASLATGHDMWEQKEIA